mmetsp:Transcript_4701/g.17037  ORF Transcript_4701/g.17037 Transcript_4701/m.17037 type:complete len:222 (-) Transcript_4701:294-959(-)
MTLTTSRGSGKLSAEEGPARRANAMPNFTALSTVDEEVGAAFSSSTRCGRETGGAGCARRVSSASACWPCSTTSRPPAASNRWRSSCRPSCAPPSATKPSACRAGYPSGTDVPPPGLGGRILRSPRRALRRPTPTICERLRTAASSSGLVMIADEGLAVVLARHAGAQAGSWVRVRVGDGAELLQQGVDLVKASLQRRAGSTSVSVLATYTTTAPSRQRAW